jgi:hypothetical protein
MYSLARALVPHVGQSYNFYLLVTFSGREVSKLFLQAEVAYHQHIKGQRLNPGTEIPACWQASCSARGKGPNIENKQKTI